MGTSIINYLQSLGADPSYLVFAVMAAVFVFVSSITYGVARNIGSREKIRQRALHTDPREDDGSDRRSLRHQRLAGTRKLLSQVGANFIPGNQESVSAIRKKLLRAGFFQPSAMMYYYMVRVVLALCLPGIAFFTIRFGGFDLPSTKYLSTLGAAAAAGLFLPGLYIGWRAKKLQQQCRDGFPDFMDLMVVCAEAGISLEAAIERVSRDLAQNYPYLGVSLHMASLELRAGKPLIEAFQNLAERIGIEEAHNLGSLLQQSEELGTSLSDALRIYSDEMRDKRMSCAEEKAHALPAKMAVPLTMFVFPTVLIVILLPVYVRVSAM